MRLFIYIWFMVGVVIALPQTFRSFLRVQKVALSHSCRGAQYHPTRLLYNRKMSSSSSTTESASASSEFPAPEAPSNPETLVNNVRFVSQRMESAAIQAGRDPTSIKLVAVSKTKPAVDIEALYAVGHRKFGENYFQELVEKAATLPNDIEWHFIGHLQSSKAPQLIRKVPNLFVVETVDSMKLAKKLNTACKNAGREFLNIYIQVDTSNEDTKSGIPASELVGLVNEINATCPLLKVKGIMTIGAPGDMSCFDRLVEARADLAAALGTSPEAFDLSMGMSGDFEEAIARGATSVRVGSIIFGARDYSKK